MNGLVETTRKGYAMTDDRTALFAIASQFFELLGYPDHWLIDVAGLALERGERAFAA